MAGAKRSGARWIALVLGIALVASAVVAYALVRVTAPTNGGGEAVASTVESPPTSTASESVSPADVMVASSDDTAATGATARQTPSTAPDTTPVTSPPPPESSSVASSGQAASAASAAGSSSAVMTTATSMLDGSGVTLPASWSGTATITVTVLGQCATATPSVYANTPADLALDLPQNEAAAVAPTVTSPLPDNEPTLTLGVNANDVPSLAIASSAVDEAGTFHRYWQLELAPGLDRTEIRGTVVDQTTGSDNPNFMVDAETSLQHCETAGTVSLPRVFAAGSTLSGWVSQTDARLTITATTTDGKREVTVVVTATRKQ